MTVFGDQSREIKRRDERGVRKEGNVFCMCADASVEEGKYKILGGLGHDVAVKVLPARGSFFVRHGQGLFEVSANTNVQRRHQPGG